MKGEYKNKYEHAKSIQGWSFWHYQGAPFFGEECVCVLGGGGLKDKHI